MWVDRVLFLVVNRLVGPYLFRLAGIRRGIPTVDQDCSKPSVYAYVLLLAANVSARTNFKKMEDAATRSFGLTPLDDDQDDDDLFLFSSPTTKLRAVNNFRFLVSFDGTYLVPVV